MSFKLTDEEKNLFIQNGLDLDGVLGGLCFSDRSEADVDFELREMIDSLKGVTPTAASDAENISKWQQKGTIGAYEFAKMNTFVDKDGVEKWQPKNTDVNESVQSVNANNKYADTPSEKFGNAWKSVEGLANKADRFAANAAKNWTYRQILAGQHDVTGRDGKIGFWEAMGKNYSTATVLPFVGGYLEGAQKEWITEIAEKIDNDTPLTWQEELIYETLVNKVKEERTRGYSIMGGIGDSLLPSLIRFGGEMALAGGVLKGVGLMNKAAKAGGIRGKFVEGLKDMGKLGAAGVVLNPSEIYSAYQARDFENKMRLTPEGEMLFAQSQEAPATTLVKSLADVALSFACEGSGKSLSALGQGAGKVGGYVVAKLSDPVNQYLAKNKNLRNVIETVYPKILDMAQKAKKIGDGVNAKTAFLADKVRFDGFLEEIGEEKLEDFLSTALGLQKENPTFDDLLQSLGGSPDEWAILCGTVALQGGALSLTSRVLQKHLGNVGMTDAEIEEVVNTLSETEKKSLVKNMLDKGIIDANTAEKIQSSEFWEDAKQKLHEEFLAQGSDEQKAKLAAELFSFMGAFKAEYGGVSDEEAFAELGTVKTEDYRNKEISDAVAERARTKREFAENFKNANYLADFLDAENISQSEYENLSDEEKRDFALTKAMEIYDAEHQGLKNERLPQDNEQTVLTGRVEYNEEQENQAPQKPLTEAQVDNLARELAEFDESGETIGAFLSVLEDDINTDNVEILKNAIQGISSGADLIDFINSKTQNKVYNQSAMMQNINPNQKVDVVDLSSQSQNIIDKKSLLSYINSLVGQNGITTKDKKAILNFIQKSYRIDKNGKGFNINVPRHIVYSSLKDNRAERSIVVNNIVDLIKQSVMIEVEKNTKKSEKPYVDEYYRFYVPVRINSDIYTIRLVAENQNKNNLFNIVKPSVYDVIIDKKRTSPKVTNAPVLRSPNNSINHSQQNASTEQITIKDMLSNVEDADGNIYFQSAVTAGAETSAEISDAQKEWQEKGTDSKYFKKWFGDSKVVDENGKPLVVYHGTNADFDTFDYDKIGTNGTSEGVGFYFTDDIETAEGYKKQNGSLKKCYVSIQKPLGHDTHFLSYEDVKNIIQKTAELQSEEYEEELRDSFVSNYADTYSMDFEYAVEATADMIYSEDKNDTDILGEIAYSAGSEFANKAVKLVTGYDGVITNGYNNEGKGGGNFYIPFTSEQIKSVDNQGTFDESNPNIYYQTGINQGEITNIDGSIVKDVSNPLDYDYLNNQVTGEKVAIEINQDIKVEEIKPQNISSDLPFNVSKKTSENKKAIKQILNIDKGKILNLTNSATNESVEFKGTTIDESISKISINDGRYNDCCLILCNSKKLFETSQKILSHNDVKKVSDLKYSRYANIAQINDKQYLLEFVIKGKNKLALYSITPIKNDIAKRVDKSSQHDIAINSIAHIQDVFKSKIVQQYNNDYKNAYKNNNPKRTGYVFQEPAQPNLFVENAAQNHNKGFVGIDLKGNRGLTDINRNLILIGTTGDVTTVLHESAHYFLNMLEELERVPDHSPKVDDVLFAIRKTLKNDGTPFTRSQHEKFAKGFEHYIYTGNARSNIFKEIYEDIKNLLKNIYEFVQKGQYFTTGEGALTEEEMKNFNNVFDEIFKLENKTVKERVFAKVLALDEKEEEIRNKQEQELAEIWAIHNQKKEKLRQEKAASEDEKSIQDIRQDAIKYADKKENAKWKEYNEDRKNVAYSILSAATDMSVAEIKRKLHSRYKKTREDIELKLREVGDKLAASGLFEDAKVKEYFGSIDFSEVDASQQLADMARSAIENDVNLDSPLNQDINRVLNQFEYLKKKAEKTKGHQNALILEAMFDMLSDVTNMSSMPSMFVEDLGKTVMSFAEKNEETLDRRTKRAGNKDVFRRYILKKLKDVKLYSKEDKRAVRLSTAHALYAQVATATSASTTERLLRKINNAMIEDIEMRKKSIIAKEIARQLRVNSKIITTKTRVQRGLYDWKTNSTWLDMAKFNKMNMSELSAELENVITPEIKALYNLDDGLKEMTAAKENSSTVDFSFESKMKKKFIEYKLSGKLENANSALMLDLLSDIIEFKNKARKAKSEKELHDMLQRYDFRNNLAEKILNVSDNQKKLIKYFFDNNSLLNWNSILRVCFGEDAVQKYSIDNEESDKIIYENKILSNFYNKALKCYHLSKTKGLKKYLCDPNGIAQLQKLFRDYEKENYVTNETIYDFKTKEPQFDIKKLNRAQIITMFTWYQNDLLRKRLINQFGGKCADEKELEKLFDYLSEEDKQFAFLLIQTCDEMYDDVNEVMIRSQGLSLEKNENYFPSVVRRHGDSVDNVSLINCRIGQPSATKKRVKSQLIAMKPTNPLSILSRHIDMMSSYVCVSEKAAFVSEIFGSPDLQRAFENAFDEQYSELKKLIGLDDKAHSVSVTPIDISISQIPDFKTVPELKKWICENVNLIGNVKIKSNGRNVQFSKTNIGRSLKGTQRSEPQKVSYQILKQLVENSIYGRKKDVDERHSKRNNGQELYYNAFTYKGKTFGVEISVDIPKRKETPNTYAGHKVKIIETIPAATKVGSKELTFNSPSIASISISDIFRLFNPTAKIKLKKNKTTDGKQIWDYLSGQVAASTFFKYSQSVRTMTEKSKKWVNNWIVSSIALSPKIAFGQLLSCINYADGKDISFLDWTKGFVHCMAHPKETIEFMKQDEFLQARFKGNLQNETMQSILSEYDKWNNVKTFFTANIRIGDMFAIMFGGKPYIDHLMKQGVSKEEAFRRFRRKTNESQQSTLPSTLSNFQRTSQNNAKSALLLAFTNTPHQYERKVIESIAELCRGQNEKTAMKNLVLYRFISPLLFEFFLQDLGFWLVLGAIGGDDDKGKIALISALNALMLGNYGAYALKGVLAAGVVNFACNMMSSKRMPFTTSSIPLVSDIERNIYTLMNDVKKGDLKTEHLISSLALLGGNATGVPFNKMINMATGLADALIEGDFAIGLHEFLGWGRGVTREAFE